MGTFLKTRFPTDPLSRTDTFGTHFFLAVQKLFEVQLGT